MTDEELVRRFEDASLPPSSFRHREHLRVAWSYVRSLPFEEAAYRFVRGLRAYVAAHGAEDRFHATVTWAYLALLAELLDEPKTRALPFEAFLAAHPELLDPRDGPIASRYPFGALAAGRARRVFVLPVGGGERSPSWSARPAEGARLEERQRPVTWTGTGRSTEDPSPS